MRVLGIDPGSIICGYGVVEKDGRDLVLIEYGVIEAAKQHKSIPLRLKTIFLRLQQVIERTLPDELAIESLFHAKNVSSLIKLAHARSAAILPCILRDIPVIEYSPREVKRAVTGNGNASKEQVQFMVRTVLGIEETPEFYDATDALAVAIGHTYKAHSPQTSSRSWKDFVEQHPGRIVK